MTTINRALNRELTQQDGWNSQDGRTTKKCRVRLGMDSLAPHFLFMLLSRVFQPSCWVSSLIYRLAALCGLYVIIIIKICSSHKWKDHKPKIPFQSGAQINEFHVLTSFIHITIIIRELKQTRRRGKREHHLKM